MMSDFRTVANYLVIWAPEPPPVAYPILGKFILCSSLHTMINGGGSGGLAARTTETGGSGGLAVRTTEARG